MKEPITDKKRAVYYGLDLMRTPITGIKDLCQGVMYTKEGIVKINVCKKWMYMEFIFGGKLFTRTIDTGYDLSNNQITRRVKAFVSHVVNTNSYNHGQISREIYPV